MRHWHLCLTAAFLTFSTAHARNLTSQEIVVIDGDTIRIDKLRYRLLAIDAPEISKPRCSAERQKGLQAKERLQQLITTAKSVRRVESGQQDRYGRSLIHLYVNDKDVGELLLRDGLAIEWKPGRAAWQDRARHWCPNATPNSTELRPIHDPHSPDATTSSSTAKP